jgi:hypothetical protein
VGHEGHTFNIQVTTGTFLDIESPQPLSVTILTGEMTSVVSMGMGVEGIAERIVREVVKVYPG